MSRQYLRSKQAEQKSLFLLLAADIKVNVAVHDLVINSRVPIAWLCVVRTVADTEGLAVSFVHLFLKLHIGFFTDRKENIVDLFDVWQGAVGIGKLCLQFL